LLTALQIAYTFQYFFLFSGSTARLQQAVMTVKSLKSVNLIEILNTLFLESALSRDVLGQ
jgi:hypothetical protein